MTPRSLVLAVALGATLPFALHAQSVERSVERWAESIAGLAERIAARVERQANLLADRLEREFADKRHGERWSRDRDPDDELAHRVLPFQGQRIDTTFAFGRNGVVDLSSVYGNITVTGWDRAEARVRAWTDRGQLEYDLSSSRVTIEHRLPRGSWRSRDSDMAYELSIPRGARLVLRTTSGDIEVRNTGGAVEANTTSGDVTIVDVSERVEVGSISGDVTLRNVKGNVDASAVSGSVEAEGIEGDIKLGSTSGDLVVTDARGRDVEMSTTSGDVAYTGAIDANGRYEFHSHSGTIDLAIPSGSNARFSVETFSGEIDSDFPITLQPGDRGSTRPRRFDFSVGSGGPRIIAESFSGDVQIRKR
jgi:DUF4097 and DUF4098 domain-containing protein YvlB